MPLRAEPRTSFLFFDDRDGTLHDPASEEQHDETTETRTTEIGTKARYAIHHKLQVI
jgi:hypothetical protein